jgi:plastocyanin
MGVRRALGLAAAAVLGAAVAVLPAVASSETPPSIEAETFGEYEHRWRPNEATVGSGGAVAISNHTGIKHGVYWVGGPELPACSAGIPVGKGVEYSGTSWEGTCTFNKPGTYVFWCSVHLKAMTATVVVTGTGTTGTTGTGTTGTGTGTTTGGTTSAPTGTITYPQRLPLGSPLASVKLRSPQHGRVVQGTVDVSSAAAGSRLEVDLFANRASLAIARSSSARVGKFVHSSVGPGIVKFKVPLSAGGRRALARAGRLALRVRITLSPRTGNAVAVQRHITLRR